MPISDPMLVTNVIIRVSYPPISCGTSVYTHAMDVGRHWYTPVQSVTESLLAKIPLLSIYDTIQGRSRLHVSSVITVQYQSAYLRDIWRFMTRVKPRRYIGVLYAPIPAMASPATLYTWPNIKDPTLITVINVPLNVPKKASLLTIDRYTPRGDPTHAAHAS